MDQKRNRKMVSCDLASFPIKKECKTSCLIGAVSIRAGDLSALSHNRAEVPLFQYRPLPPLEMTIAAGSIQSFQREKK